MGIYERSLIGGVLIALIWAGRGVLRRRIPARLMLLLWAMALVRLLMPVRFEVPVPAQATEAVRMTDTIRFVNPVQPIESSFLGEQDELTDVLIESDHSRLVGRYLIYAAGVGLTGISFAALYLLNRRRLGELRPVCGGVPLRAGFRSVRLYESDAVASPVSMGLFRPQIVLPTGMRMDDSGAELILAHELSHIRGFHGLWKAVSLAAVCVHWFNPLVWIMRALLARDLELIADEEAVKTAGGIRREEYARLLISMAGRERGNAVVSAFGGRKMKERIVNIMKQRRNSVWAILLAVLLLAASVCAFAEPVEKPPVQPEDPEAVPAIGDGHYQLMTKEEFRQWVLLRTGMVMAAGECDEEEAEWIRTEGLDALLECVEGDEVEMINFIRWDEDRFVGEINLIVGDDGVWRVVTASSHPMNEILGTPVELLEEGDLAILEPQAGTIFEAEIHGLKKRGGVLFEALAPGCSREEAEAAGLVFQDGVVGTQENTAKNLTSETIAVDPMSVEMRLDGNVMQDAWVQFVNGQLINLELTAPDEEGAKAIHASLTEELGQPSEKSLPGVSDTTRLLLWEFRAEAMTVRAQMSVREDADGEMKLSRVMFSWLPDELFGETAE